MSGERPVTVTTAGLRRVVQRMGIVDEPDLVDSDREMLPVLFALEAARDIARIAAMAADGPEATRAWRWRRRLIAIVEEVFIADLGAHNGDESLRLMKAWEFPEWR